MAESEQQQPPPSSVKGHGQSQSQIHVLMVAFSAFGHVQPMHKLAMQLARRGVLVSLATFKLSFAKLHALHAATPHPNVRIYSLPDDLPHDYVFDYIHMLFHVIFHLDGSHLEALLRQLHVTGPPVCHVIYNHFLLWVRPLCRKLGLRHSVFWTMAASVFATCLHFFTNVSELETVGHRKSRTIPGLKNELEEADLPGGLTLSPRYVDVFREQFRDLEKLDWILANSIYELENDAFDLIRSKSINFVGVGPCIGSAFLDENYGTIHGDRDRPGYLKWLDGQQERSVVYVAFGSISTMGREQVEEIAFGIQESGEKFLWVIRGIADMIPKGFAEQTKDRGLMVDWCDDQLQVLFHGSVGAFLSHCGWNSTLESLYAGVPVIAFPIWGDQPMDAKILCEDFRTGIRIQKQKECQNMVGREELARCIKFMLSDQNSEVDQMRKNGQKWKQIATSAMDNGGSSANTLSNFLEDVMHEAKEELCLLSPSSVATACKDDGRM